MKLLIDANLSPALVLLLADICPGSAHVFQFGLQHSDAEILAYAIENEYMVLTKDDDFESAALLMGPPAKVIRIGLGNCTSSAVHVLLRTEIDQLRQLCESETESVLVLPDTARARR